jgi:hypothetical protein
MAKVWRRLVLPRNRVSLKGHRLIFLAGPDLGAGNWRSKAISFLSQKLPRKFYFVFPCHFGRINRFKRRMVKSNLPAFESEAKWKRFYMEMSASSGCLLFWLGPQDKEEDVDFSKEPYGLEVYGEQGEWALRLFRNSSLRVVIGIHHSFPGRDKIVENWKLLLGSDFPIYGRLQDLLEAVAKMAK